MQLTYTTLLTLALSATTLAFPAPSNITSPDFTELEKRGGGPKISSFDNMYCSGKPINQKWTDGNDWSCFKFTPVSDNVGINWSTQMRALGITFFTDDKCTNWATKSVIAPQTQMGDNGKGKADKCISYNANGGNWKSARFIFPGPWQMADLIKQAKEQKKEEAQAKAKELGKQKIGLGN
ncbi:MAG: hypothetical protein Q9166_007485 [cf. Caloplaca sp. 2 TL-2023]